MPFVLAGVLVVHINRITVEFKYITQTISTAEDKILIESQWNLNAERLY